MVIGSSVLVNEEPAIPMTHLLINVGTLIEPLVTI